MIAAPVRVDDSTAITVSIAPENVHLFTRDGNGLRLDT